MPEYATVDELKKLMKKYNLTSVDIAKHAGVAAQSVRRWLCGMRPVPAYVIKLIKLERK